MDQHRLQGDRELDRQLNRLLTGRQHDPDLVLGINRDGDCQVIRVFLPEARCAWTAEKGVSLTSLPHEGLFEYRFADGDLPEHYRIRWSDRDGVEHIEYDPYSFAPQLTEYDLHLFGEGRHRHAHRVMGAHLHSVDGIEGVLFATWAPNAERVSVVGDFNRWNGLRHPMRVRGSSGVWELFIPGLAVGELYKFEIRPAGDVLPLVKSDPYGRQFESRPNTASLVMPDVDYDWADEEWMRAREAFDWQHSPMSIFEVHLGSWRRRSDGGFLNYRELARELIPYVADLGFTHIELLPVTEHPLDASWGYQPTGFFAPSSRFGAPDDFRYFVDECHRHGLGLILDWVAGHFPADAHALARYDGTALYEHADPRRGHHRDWGTLVFNYGRNEVRGFLISSALFWLEEFHIDGLRVDAVASMLYLDYSRNPGEWIPNQYGGRENLEAIAFLRELNDEAQSSNPGVVMIAEESTAWPQVTRPSWVGGLGFSMKWNMGWMHDTLQYMSKDPVYRHYHHENLSFGLLYAFHENFVLPFSHDETVHGKGSLIDRMPGDDWQRFANLRLLFTYMYTYPGKKLLFMGCEFGQLNEWDHAGELDWRACESPRHAGVRNLVRDLNNLYRSCAALSRFDFEAQGFDWIDCHDSEQSVLSYTRFGNDDTLVVILNFTPIPRHAYRIGVPQAGEYREVLNSDSQFYGGSDLGNGTGLASELVPWMGRAQSISLTVPPLAGLVLRLSH